MNAVRPEINNECTISRRFTVSTRYYDHPEVEWEREAKLDL